MTNQTVTDKAHYFLGPNMHSSRGNMYGFRTYARICHTHAHAFAHTHAHAYARVDYLKHILDEELARVPFEIIK